LVCLVLLVCAFVLCFALHPKCGTAPTSVIDLIRRRARLSESRAAVAPCYWPESAESLGLVIMKLQGLGSFWVAI
jgi:hypothetical protein